MSVVSLASGRPIDAEALGKRRAAAQAEFARNTARLDEERRAWRERKRAWRYLRRGGVALREDLGGAIGARWVRASRHGPALDTSICERWLERGRLLLRESGPGYRWSTAACEPPPRSYPGAVWMISDLSVGAAA